MSKHPPLTAEGRRKLRLLGFPSEVEMRICSKCHLSMEQLPKGPHPLQSRIVQARRLLERDRRNVLLSRQVQALVNQMHFSSKCCQARLKTIMVDNYQPLWETWLEREERVPDLSLVKKATDAGQVVTPSQQQQFRQHVQGVKPRLRIAPIVPALAPIGVRDDKKPLDPDFRRMAFLWGLDAPVTRLLIKFFREEEERQATAKETPQEIAAI